MNRIKWASRISPDEAYEYLKDMLAYYAKLSRSVRPIAPWNRK